MTAMAVDGNAQTQDGVMLSYTRYTAPEGAPRIVFVHSLGLDRDVWSPVAEALAGRVELLIYDCRGHGRSDRPAGPYSTEQFADDLADLLNQLGWTDTFVAGCSMGGCVAQDFAARYRYRTRGALFVDTTAWYGPTAEEDWAERAEAAKLNGFESLVPFHLGRWFGDAFRAANPRLMNRLTKQFTANSLHAYQASCAMLGATDLRAMAVAIPHPVTVLVGAADQETPPAMAYDLAARIGDSPALIVPGTSHLTPLENPGVVVEALKDLLQRTTAVRIDS
jgi:3-oxoadipate enol-lactonase